MAHDEPEPLQLFWRFRACGASLWVVVHWGELERAIAGVLVVGGTYEVEAVRMTRSEFERLRDA